MSGFIKYQKPIENLTEQTASSGIPTLDRIFPLFDGTVNCVYESENSFFHNTVLQIFISSCFDKNQNYFVLAKEEKLLLRFQVQKEASVENETPKNLVIAWRYKSQNTTEPKFKWDLLLKDTIEKKVVINDLNELINLLKTQKSLKIAIFSLFSPLFGSFSKDEIFNILFDIKKYSRLNGHLVFMSIPKFLVNENISTFFDSILQINSNLLFPHEMSYYSCYIELIKIGAAGTLRVNNLESMKYGVVLKSKKVKIERIDVPPEETVPNNNGGCSQSF